MALPALLRDNLSIPMVGAPQCILSNPALVIEQCKAEVVASFPALSARPKELPEDRVQHDIDVTNVARGRDRGPPHVGVRRRARLNRQRRG